MARLSPSLFSTHSDAEAPSNCWETPDYIFAELHQEFNFTIDLAANEYNAKLPRYFSPKQNSLWQEWTGRGWLNPPYGRGLAKWVAKAYRAVHELQTAELIVLLIPARPDTAYWHDYILHDKAQEIRFRRGRISFWARSKALLNPAPFPSAVVVYRREEVHVPCKFA